MLIRIFLLGPQRSIGLPDVHSGCGFAIVKIHTFVINKATFYSEYVCGL